MGYQSDGDLYFYKNKIFLLRFKPDLDKNITQVDVLGTTQQTIGTTASFTADIWFGSLEWMNSHPNALVTMTLKKTKTNCSSSSLNMI